MKLNNQTIKQLRQGLKDKQFSSGELVNACLAEIEKRNQNLNAFITVCANHALEQAKKADE